MSNFEEIWNTNLQSLTQRAANNDEGAITALYNHYEKPMIRYARNYVSNNEDAQDAVQNAFINAFRHISSLEDGSKFEAWLRRIVRNEATSLVRGKLQNSTTYFTDMEDEEGNLQYDPSDEKIESRPDLVLDQQTTKELIVKILDSLPEEQRLVTMMYYYEHLTMKDIAQELDIPQSTVVGRINTAKKNIKTSVLSLEKTDGIKLYSLTPLTFFLYLLSLLGQTDPASIPMRVPTSISGSTRPAGHGIKAVLEGLQSGDIAAKSASAVTGTTAAAAALTAADKAKKIVQAQAAVNTVKKAGIAAVIRKAIPAVLAGTVLVGGTGGVILYKTKYQVHVTIDKSQVTQDQDVDVYYLNEDFEGFQGTFRGSEKLVKHVDYEIIDEANVVLQQGELDFSNEEWKISEPAMLPGLNELKVTATLINGKTVTDTVTIVDESGKYIKQVTVDTEDPDEDGLVNYLEESYGTDPEKADTDEDGLSDALEKFITYTDPVKYSTADDDISDGDRDTDGDGLTNLQELEIGTDPGSSDTDGDGLTDGKEHLTHKTDPKNADTDGDHAWDKWELDNGWDPLIEDEVIEITEECKDDKASASVTIVVGEAPNHVSIQPKKTDDLFDASISEQVYGAVEVDCEEDFESAEITISNDSLNSDEEFMIYFYDEETQTLEAQETIIEDKTAKAVIHHKGIYILLNKKTIDEVYAADIASEESLDDSVVNIAFAVDYSSSMTTNDPEYLRVKIVKEYISKLRDNRDQAALVQYAGSATVLAGMTADKAVLINAVDLITNESETGCESGTGTNGSAGLRAAMNQIESSPYATDKYVIILTDGEDTTASYDYDQLIQEAVDNGIVVFSVGMGDCDEELLRKISESTGGTYYYATVGEIETEGTVTLQEAFDKIEESTIDHYPDANEDGITDYYAKLICSGELTTGTGTNPFKDITEETLLENSDLDEDGLLNGEEVQIKDKDGFIYMEVSSDPLQKDTDHDGYPDGEDEHPAEWDVGDRDLAIFAALAYEDGSEFKEKMYSAGDIVGKPDEPGQSYYFLNYADISSLEKDGREGMDHGISEDWKIVDYVNIPTEFEQITDYAGIITEPGLDNFSATTFKNGDNVVIAYRGTSKDTNVENAAEWADNIINYGMLGTHCEEKYARNYARKIAAQYPNSNIYITGHSLGGYLAQVGTIQLIEDGINKPKHVAYFNGIGMNYYIPYGILAAEQLMAKSFTTYNPGQGMEVSSASKIRNALVTSLKTPNMKILSDYYDGSNLISYNIGGDVVSAIGEHCGDKKTYQATAEAIANHKGKHNDGLLSKISPGIVSSVIQIEANEYAKSYGLDSLIDYMWVTHETDSFLYYIGQGLRVNPAVSPEPQETNP